MNKRLPLDKLDCDIIVHVEADSIVLRFNQSRIKALETDIRAIRMVYNELVEKRREETKTIEEEMRLLRNRAYNKSQQISMLSSEIGIELASESSSADNVKMKMDALGCLKVSRVEDLDIATEKKKLIDSYDRTKENEINEIIINKVNELESLKQVKAEVRRRLSDKSPHPIYFLDDESLAMKLDLPSFATVIDVMDKLHLPASESTLDKNSGCAVKIKFTPYFYEVYIKLLDSKSITLSAVDNLKKMDLANPYYPIDILPNPVPAYDHQKIGFHFASELKDSGLFWEMRTGKTRTSIELLTYRFHRKEIEKVLIVAPATATFVWEDQVKQYSKLIPAIITGTKKDKLSALYSRKNQVLICSYEAVSTLKNELTDYLGSFEFQMILDESSKIKNAYAKRTKATINLGKLAKYRNILTGTPVTQGAHDLFSQFLFLDNGETFGTNREEFIGKYFDQQGFYIRPKPNALVEISDLVYKKATRFLKKDIRIDGKTILPKLYDTVRVDMTAEQARIYKEMAERAVVEIEAMGVTKKAKASIMLVQILRLSQISSGFISTQMKQELNIPGPNPKIDAIEEILEQKPYDQQVVIWSRFKRDLSNLEILLSRKSIPYVRLDGDVSRDPEVRRELVNKFQTGKVNVFIGTPKTGGMSISLKPATLAIYMSNDYSWETRAQSEDRIWELTTKEQCSFIDIVCNNTIDYAIMAILRAKKNVADIVTKDDIRSMAELFTGGLNDFLKGLIDKL